jgi:CHAT domain-containing protein
VSLWPVRDALAGRFMTALYDHLWRGETIRDALWAAKLSLINAASGGCAGAYAWAASTAICSAGIPVI